MGRRKNST